MFSPYQGVLIADAPPHGLEPSGDGFPNGDPEGRDPLEILRDMAVHGITCYTVGSWDLKNSLFCLGRGWNL